jgi:hypothetical protein
VRSDAPCSSVTGRVAAVETVQECQHHRCRDDRARPCGRRLPDVTALIAALVVPDVAMASSTSFFNSPRVIITRPDLTAISNMRRTRPGIARPSSSIVRNCSMSIQILKASLVGGSRRTHTVRGRRLRSDGMVTSRCSCDGRYTCVGSRCCQRGGIEVAPRNAGFASLAVSKTALTRGASGRIMLAS